MRAFPKPPHARLSIFGFLLGLCLLTVLIYQFGLSGGFFFDDEANIVFEPRIRIEALDANSLRQVIASGRSGPSGRPVAQLSFAFNYYANGLSPFAFKASNLAIHILCGLLVFFLARTLLKAIPDSVAKQSDGLALWITATWLLHPIQLLPVLHVVQRMTSLSALFLFAAMLLHILSRERGDRTGAAGLAVAWCLLWPLSFFSKETGVLFPFFVLAWELTLRRSMHVGLDRFARVLAWATGVVLATGLIYALIPAGRWLWAGYSLRDFTLTERLLSEGRVIWTYIGLILLPRLEALGVYHDDILVSTSLLEPWTTLPAIFGMAGLAWLAWQLRARACLVSFGISWFLIGHALESTVLPLEIAHEHRNYLPLFGLLLAAADLLARALKAGDTRRTIALSLAGAALLYFSFLTGLRAHQFGEPFRLSQIEAQHHVNSARAQYEAGRILAAFPEATLKNSPIFLSARGHLQRAANLGSNSKLAVLGLLYLDCRAGIATETGLFDELSRRLRETPFGPSDSTTMYAVMDYSIDNNLCLTRDRVEQLFSAAHANPTVSPHVHAMLHYWLANYLVLAEHDITAAEAELGRSLAIEPTNSSMRLKRAQLLMISGAHKQAQQLLLELRNENFSANERKTLNELLATYNIVAP